VVVVAAVWAWGLGSGCGGRPVRGARVDGARGVLVLPGGRFEHVGFTVGEPHGCFVSVAVAGEEHGFAVCGAVDCVEQVLLGEDGPVETGHSRCEQHLPGDGGGVACEHDHAGAWAHRLHA
jgi:hypothetical protein